MPLILDGRKARVAMLPALKTRIAALPQAPTLAIVQVGDRADSTAYIRAKNSFAAKIGVAQKLVRFPESVSEQEVVAQIKTLNGDAAIQGIIVQLPLPAAISRAAVIEAIDPRKDVDALTSASVQGWTHGRGIVPATARGVHELLDFYKISLKGKNVTVVGRSELVGTPIAVMCRNEGSTVTVCHSKTLDLAAETKPADIIIVAVGKPRLIGKEHVKAGQVVVDVGISRIGEERLSGDVDFETVAPILGQKGAISPVPGGVGQMTVLALFENLLDLCSKT